ncbi:ATP-binding protein [Roseivirga pacifica]
MINRFQLSYAKDRLFNGKALIIYGPRQVGKTTFVELLLQNIKSQKVLSLNGDDSDTRELLSNPNVTLLRSIIGESTLLFIDEAQRIDNIGILIKIIVDRIKNVQVIATGSSSFELANHINEPLTGRKYEMLLLPFSFQELVSDSDLITEKRKLNERLVFGSYPEIVTKPAKAEEHLKLLTDSYLYKDIFTLDRVNKPQLLQKIVKALALQVGSEVNINELAQLVRADNKTVEKYISLLEMSFVIFTLPALSRNVRNEIKKGRKIYFYDNGILNAVIGNLASIKKRTDIGGLWENYLISERVKRQYQLQIASQNYFWRTTQQQEVDFIEEVGSEMSVYEFKWNPKSKAKIPATFTKNYPTANMALINSENYYEFLLHQP